jgi:uncharacterized surface protein with fasciclin (FAS1) repeats
MIPAGIGIRTLTRQATQETMMKTTIALLALTLSTTGITAQGAASRDIVDTAVANGSFTTLATALKAAGLVETLKGPGPFTVFAPTDAAFAKLPAGTVESLLKPENRDKLRRVLTYHVVSGKVGSAEVVKMTSAKTVAGDPLTISSSGGSVTVNDAKVVIADVAASNGVIHVIDTVLIPAAR